MAHSNPGEAPVPGPVTFPPDCAAKFRWIRPLASGGFGGVVLAEQLDLGRQVAVKLLHSMFSTNAKQLERFTNEARLTASIVHPNVITVLDHGAECGTPWIAYEYMPCGSVRELLNSRQLSPDEAIQIVFETAQGLACAHAAGILHRDIKPENILIAEDGRYKITDFGIARGQSVSEIRTELGVILGTPEYLPPEVLGERPLTVAGDIYSLGIVFFELLAGCPPFRGDSVLATLDRHAREPVPRVSERRAGLPYNVDPILLTMLAKAPDERYHSMQALIDDLNNLRTSPEESSPGRTVSGGSRPIIRRLTRASSMDRSQLSASGVRPTVVANRPRNGISLKALGLVMSLLLLVGGMRQYKTRRDVDNLKRLRGQVAKLESASQTVENHIHTIMCRFWPSSVLNNAELLKNYLDLGPVNLKVDRDILANEITAVEQAVQLDPDRLKAIPLAGLRLRLTYCLAGAELIADARRLVTEHRPAEDVEAALSPAFRQAARRLMQSLHEDLPVYKKTEFELHPDVTRLLQPLIGAGCLSQLISLLGNHHNRDDRSFLDSFHSELRRWAINRSDPVDAELAATVMDMWDHGLSGQPDQWTRPASQCWIGLVELQRRSPRIASGLLPELEHWVDRWGWVRQSTRAGRLTELDRHRWLAEDCTPLISRCREMLFESDLDLKTSMTIRTAAGDLAIQRIPSVSSHLSFHTRLSNLCFIDWQQARLAATLIVKMRPNAPPVRLEDPRVGIDTGISLFGEYLDDAAACVRVINETPERAESGSLWFAVDLHQMGVLWRRLELESDPRVLAMRKSFRERPGFRSNGNYLPASELALACLDGSLSRQEEPDIDVVGRCLERLKPKIPQVVEEFVHNGVGYLVSSKIASLFVRDWDSAKTRVGSPPRMAH